MKETHFSILHIEDIIYIGIFFLPCDEFVNMVRLPNFLFENGNAFGNVLVITMVNGRVVGLFSSENHRFPAIIPQVFGDFQTPQYAYSSTWRPIITYN